MSPFMNSPGESPPECLGYPYVERSCRLSRGLEVQALKEAEEFCTNGFWQLNCFPLYKEGASHILTGRMWENLTLVSSPHSFPTTIYLPHHTHTLCGSRVNNSLELTNGLNMEFQPSILDMYMRLFILSI